MASNNTNNNVFWEPVIERTGSAFKLFLGQWSEGSELNEWSEWQAGYAGKLAGC